MSDRATKPDELVHGVDEGTAGTPVGHGRSRREAGRESLRRRLARAEEDERRRVARELHDQLGQHLTAFTLGVDEARRLAGPDSPAQPILAQLAALAHLMARDVRHLALELHPPELDDVGLESALETYVAQWRARFQIDAELAVTSSAVDRPLSLDTAAALYRIVQEALTNVAKHARAQHVSVIVDRTSEAVRLLVEDDGCGFDPAAVRRQARSEHRLGFASMGERASLAGGTFHVESSPGAGTTVYVRVPLAPGRRAPGPADRAPPRTG